MYVCVFTQMLFMICAILELILDFSAASGRLSWLFTLRLLVLIGREAHTAVSVSSLYDNKGTP